MKRLLGLFSSELPLRRGDLSLLLFISVLLLGNLIPLAWRTASMPDEVIAIIERNGELLDQFSLSQISEPLQRIYSYNDQYNTILLEPGRICVLEANCPQQVDIRAGWLYLPGESAICLPHRFVVRLVGHSGKDHGLDAIVR